MNASKILYKKVEIILKIEIKAVEKLLLKKKIILMNL